jgi:hypothetical protein
MQTDELYPGMPVIVHFSYERFGPEPGKVMEIDGDRKIVSIASPSGSLRAFRVDTQGLDGEFGYQAYFNTLAQDLFPTGVDEAEEGLRRFRVGQVLAKS